MCLSLNAAVEELVYNSIDAKAKSVAIRVDLTTGSIAVVDDGVGIRNIEDISRKRGCTSKTADRFSCYGYRGESLYKIRKLCRELVIQTMCKTQNTKTNCAVFRGSRYSLFRMPARSCRGTAVTVRDVYHRIPIAKKVASSHQETLFRLKQRLVLIGIANPTVSISLVNIPDMTIVFNVYPRKSFLKVLSNAFSQKFRKQDFQRVYIHDSQERCTVAVFIHKFAKLYIDDMVFVNRRPLDGELFGNLLTDAKSSSNIAKNKFMIAFVGVQSRDYSLPSIVRAIASAITSVTTDDKLVWVKSDKRAVNVETDERIVSSLVAKVCSNNNTPLKAIEGEENEKCCSNHELIATNVAEELDQDSCQVSNATTNSRTFKRNRSQEERADVASNEEKIMDTQKIARNICSLTPLIGSSYCGNSIIQTLSVKHNSKKRSLVKYRELQPSQGTLSCVPETVYEYYPTDKSVENIFKSTGSENSEIHCRSLLTQSLIVPSTKMKAHSLPSPFAWNQKFSEVSHEFHMEGENSSCVLKKIREPVNSPGCFFNHSVRDNFAHSQSTSKSGFHLDAEDLDSLNVIGQFGRKFILSAKETEKGFHLIAIDQHAAHERFTPKHKIQSDYYDWNLIFESFGYRILMSFLSNARYNENAFEAKTELNSRNGVLKSAILIETIDIELDKASYELVKSRNLFKKYGIDSFYCSDSEIVQVNALPFCAVYCAVVQHKPEAEQKSFLKLLAKELMSECVLLATAFNQDLPHCVLELLKLEACRYAIKFGDELTIEECDGLIKHLKVCESPFICAHGRPSIVSLASVQGGKITEKLPVYND
ncbi:uncharacterized protein LOC134839131 [Symsagittifera roscoffensis]|uniref:uncharacterized protein LOC134839131 n=1 Tax=Symsagittifera roscoffensis TaxID=84072 RepID=UPI00307B2945